VGLEGEALECVLPAEAAYHAGSKKYTGYKDLITFGNPNGRTIGIELCHSIVEGRFSDVTLEWWRLWRGISARTSVWIPNGISPRREPWWAGRGARVLL